MLRNCVMPHYNHNAHQQRANNADSVLAGCRKYTNINMARASYSRKVKNANPSYTVPDSHTARLPFIQDLVALSQSRDVTRSDVAMYTRAISEERQKQFYPDRTNAMRTLHTVFSEHVNLVTHQIKISIRNASDAAGLSTISDEEKEKVEKNKDYIPVVSISRASRAFKSMILLGWIVAPDHWQVWDKERGYWIDKYFEATPLFFEAVGITAERVEKQKKQRLAWLKKKALDSGMTAESVGRMSISQIKTEHKMEWRRAAFNRRAAEQDKKKTKARIEGKGRAEQRTEAIKQVLVLLGQDIEQLTTAQFKDLVNKEIARMRRITNTSPPLH
uniref:Replication associated protein RepA1 n=1 Tax=Hirondellea gigas TaxID=1518452 RepID=A0A6A7G5T6_9CRUS